MLGGLLSFALFSALSSAEMESWGWRIPFIIGALLGPVGLVLRLRIEDAVTPPQQKKAAAATPEAVAQPGTLTLLRQHYKSILTGIMLVIGMTIRFCRLRNCETGESARSLPSIVTVPLPGGGSMTPTLASGGRARCAAYSSSCAAASGEAFCIAASMTALTTDAMSDEGIGMAAL